MSDEAMLSSERIAELLAALDLDIAKLGAGAANGFAVGDEVMLPGELRALLKATRRLAVAEGLLREAASGVPVGWTCYRRTKAVDDPTDVEDMLVPLRAGEPGSCGECLSCRVAALLAPSPATPATADEASG